MSGSFERRRRSNVVFEAANTKRATFCHVYIALLDFFKVSSMSIHPVGSNISISTGLNEPLHVLPAQAVRRLFGNV